MASDENMGVLSASSLPQQDEAAEHPTTPEAAPESSAIKVKGMAKLSGWAEQCSKHLSHIEQRSMYSDVLGHEMVRQLCIVIDGFVPPPRGDWGYLLRKVRNLCTIGVRQLIKYYYNGTHERIESFMMRAMFVMHLYVEESFHRCLKAAKSPVRRRALCTLMLTMKKIEQMVYPEECKDLRCFSTFSEFVVRAIAEHVEKPYEDTNIEYCWSYHVAMRTEMKMEVLSLLEMTDVPSEAIEMTRDEVKALIEHNKCDDIQDGEKVPGREGQSRFAELFADEAPAAGGAEAMGSR